MKRQKKPVDGPFDVKLDEEARRDLTEFLCTEIQNALDHRESSAGDINYAYALYEQQRTRGRDSGGRADEPYVDGADLTSFIPCEKVDALTSRAVKTIFTEPIWIVEGIGKSAAKAPLVEEFHQWKVESERLQMHFARAIKMAFIERRAAIEVYEGSQPQRIRKTIYVRLQTEVDPVTGDSHVVIDPETGEPQFVQGPPGQYDEVDISAEPETAVGEMSVESWEWIRQGPRYRVLGSREFLVLPGHAKQREDMWGWAKQCYLRVPQLKERVKRKIYDAKAVEELGPSSERDATTREENIVPQTEPETAEKELWEITFLRDLDDDGFEEWYLATVSVVNRKMLRLKRDDLDQQRFILLVPLVRPDTELDGYSVVLDKLLTIAEEHTARRNMIADRSALVNGAPVKRLEGCPWDPEEIPWGPRAIIPVTNMNEVDVVSVPDVPESSWRLLAESIESSERVIGMNDTSLGINPDKSRTLGEVRMVAGYSEIRIEEILMNLREAMEDLFQVRHAIYIRLLEEQGEKAGGAPSNVQVGLERRLADSDVTFDGIFTADMLRGDFRGKPRGSVESADVNMQRSDFNEFLMGLAAITKVNPMIAQLLATPKAAQALLEHALRVFRFPDRQAILSSATEMLQQQRMAPQMSGMPQQAPGMMLQGGAPPMGGPQVGQQIGGGIASQVAQSVMANLGG